MINLSECWFYIMKNYFRKIKDIVHALAILIQKQIIKKYKL